MEKDNTKIYDVPSGRCDDGHSVFDVIDEMKKAGKIPENSFLSHATSTQGGYYGKGKCVGIVQVRQNEYYWIETR